MKPIPFTYELHGKEISDPYRWLEDLDSPETRRWIESQNERTFHFLDEIPQREVIRRRVTALWNYQRCGVPFKEGDRYFFMKNDGLQNQAVLYVKDALEAPARMLLDPNALSADGTVALTSAQASRDGRLMAYGLSKAGSDWEEWRVLNVESGADLPDRLDWVKFSATSWTPDGKGFFYSRYDKPAPGEKYEGQNYFQKLYYHRIGAAQDDDALIYERRDEKEWNFAGIVTEDGRYLILHVWAASNYNLIFYRDLDAASATSTVELIPSFHARYQFIGNDGPVFWLLTDYNAPRGKVIAIDTRAPEPANWRDLIPETEHTLEHAAAIGNSLVGVYLADAHTRVKVFDRAGGFVRNVDLPGIGTATGFAGRPQSPETFFDFTSFTAPSSVYRYDVGTGEQTLFHESPLRFEPRPV
jgi:prolyl oligopeptidase